jgi:demethylmenaquinone methyltransferase/2-methoxy-6-polyprenyl-1,4-benzoquinol methylase
MQKGAEYSAGSLIQLFTGMAQTYGTVNLVSSLGFSHLWRKACVDALAVESGHRCADLMAGMAEATVLLAAAGAAAIDAVDFCPAMTARAEEAVRRRGLDGVRVTTGDVFDLAPGEAYDRVGVAFGIKTLSDDGRRRFAELMYVLLRAGGRAALVEIHVPRSRILRMPYLWYLRHAIPWIGRLALGDPDCYRSLAVYTEAFAARERFEQDLADSGFRVGSRSLFFGCARLYVADKPS